MVATPDPRWLEILKTSGGPAFAAACACWLMLLLKHFGLIPDLPDWCILLLVFGGLIFSCLALVSAVSALDKFFDPRARIAHWSRVRQSRKAVDDYIHFMTDREKMIIGYLLEKKESGSE